MSSIAQAVVEPGAAAHRDAPAVSASRLGIAFVCCCVLLGLVKLWIVRGEEIALLPYDEVVYLQQAQHWYWGRSAFNFLRPPGYPLFIALSHLTGVPLRITTELVLLAGAFALCAALIKLSIPRFLCALCFAFIAFNPWTIEVAGRAHCDAFYFAVELFAIAGLIVLLLKRTEPARIWYAIIAGLALAVLWNTRAEKVLIVAWLAVYGLLILWLARRHRQSWRSTLAQTAILAGVPAAVVIVAMLCVKTANYARFGVFADSEYTAPGLKAAYNALLRIKPQRPVRFAPVTLEARRLAYSVSPAMRGFEPWLDGPAGRKWRERELEIAEANGVKEIPAVIFIFALRNSVYMSSHRRSVREGEDFFWRIAAEINIACDDGRLPARRVYVDYLDPHFSNYVPYLPQAFGELVKVFIATEAPPRLEERADQPRLRPLFDTMANRRSALMNSGTFQLEGWALCAQDPLEQVAVRDEKVKTLAVCEEFRSRPAIQSRYSKKYGNIIPPPGFFIDGALPSPTTFSGNLVFTTHGGSDFTIPWQSIETGKTKTRAHPDRGQALHYRIETLVFSGAGGSRSKAQLLIWAVHGKAILILSYTALAALIALFICWRRLDLRQPVYAVIIFLAAVVASRVALFTVIVASSFTGVIQRYLLPVMPLYTCVLLLLIWQGATAFQAAFSCSGKILLPRPPSAKKSGLDSR